MLFYEEELEEYEETMPQTMDEWMEYNGLSWKDFQFSASQSAEMPHYKRCKRERNK